MVTSKITLAFVALLTAGALQACNGSHDKTGMETETGQPAAHENASGSDTSHTTDGGQKTDVGEAARPEAAPSANGSTTAQGMQGGDSVYQKNSMKSQK